MLRVTRHRRFTANHTWHVDVGGRRLFVKANPTPAEAAQEIAGHARLRGHYPVPALYGAWRVAGWTVLAYQRWPHLDVDRGLLLDEITRADLSGDHRRLDDCLTAILGRYRAVLTSSAALVCNEATVGKLYADRARPGGRLDDYYRPDLPWLTSGDHVVRPSTLANLTLIINEHEHRVHFAELLSWLRSRLLGQGQVWAGLTQGDPTDVNVGWSPDAGAVWFDYDTAGLNAIAGESACFLLYQRLHGAWLTPTYNSAAFVDHPATLSSAVLLRPDVHVSADGAHGIRIDYRHRTSSARRHVIARYLDELVRPIAATLGISDLMDWLRPYLVMRLLGVYDLATLAPPDAAVSLALLAETLDPATRLTDLLGLADAREERVA
jgi:hypothetical protein